MEASLGRLSGDDRSAQFLPVRRLLKQPLHASRCRSPVHGSCMSSSAWLPCRYKSDYKAQELSAGRGYVQVQHAVERVSPKLPFCFAVYSPNGAMIELSADGPDDYRRWISTLPLFSMSASLATSAGGGTHLERRTSSFNRVGAALREQVGVLWGTPTSSPPKPTNPPTHPLTNRGEERKRSGLNRASGFCQLSRYVSYTVEKGADEAGSPIYSKRDDRKRESQRAGGGSGGRMGATPSTAGASTGARGGDDSSCCG